MSKRILVKEINIPNPYKDLNDLSYEEFKKAMDLVKACDDKLKSAEDTIAKIVKDNGEVVDFDVE